MKEDKEKLQTIFATAGYMVNFLNMPKKSCHVLNNYTALIIAKKKGKVIPNI